MNNRSLIVLASLIAGLALLLAVVERSDWSGSGSGAGLFLAGFAQHANDVRELRLRFPGEEEGFAIRRDGDTWVVDARDNHPADFDQLAGFVSALAEARIVEEKTSDPEKYDQLGVGDPADGGSGTAVQLSGEGFSYEVVIGEQARGTFRYAREVSAKTSYLVDQKLDVPSSPDDWLVTDIIDIASSDVRRVTIAHADGETITIEKPSADDQNFSVLDIPAGRELSYASVANGIAGALHSLSFEEVRAIQESSPTATATFETSDGLQVLVSVIDEEESDWLQFSAAPMTNEAVAGSPDSEVPGPAARAIAINERLGNWQYRVADYKKNQFLRRWEDILKDSETKD